jgi:2-keto-4-pentenoate hydratase/2-oxohepta-3-ene-1,7-dioic acid hydratase in catechol pathway
MTTSWHFTDGTVLPVGTMYCIGRNYAAHAREMGAEIVADPIVFLKPPAAYRSDNADVALPSFSQDVHHEVELVVVIGHDTDGCTAEEAWRFIAGVTVGIDLTARDIQSAAKKNGHPWAVAKSWAGSAPCGVVIPSHACGQGPWDLQLLIDGEIRQQSSTGLMERSVEQLVAYLSSVFTLRAGDCIFTGTPEGVGPVRAGQIAKASLNDLVTLTTRFA